ncbi:MAG: Zn-ribbon domain-containing OB-fold protein [Actinomycetota bacterium]|nr:Zn-ribbon domain-containing OB-fold protein [Actinomycetota bacterium]
MPVSDGGQVSGQSSVAPVGSGQASGTGEDRATDRGDSDPDYSGAASATEWGDRPVPIPDGVSARYWEAAAGGELLLQACKSCGTLQFYPRLACRECGGAPEWVSACRRGTVYTFTVIHQNGSRAFRERVPYVVAMVELDEGPRMMGNITDCEPGDVRIGMRVEAYFIPAGEGIGIPMWRPLAAGM